MKELKETHIHGIITIEQEMARGLTIGDFGIQIAKDGRIWICVNGQALIRFKPLPKEKSMPKEFYDVQDVINAECTLEPIKCRNCGSLEVTFNQYIGDAQCAMCGEWQLNLPVDRKKKKLEVCFECGNLINPDEAYEIPYHNGDGPYCGKCQTKLIDEDEKED